MNITHTSTRALNGSNTEILRTKLLRASQTMIKASVESLTTCRRPSVHTFTIPAASPSLTATLCDALPTHFVPILDKRAHYPLPVRLWPTLAAFALSRQDVLTILSPIECGVRFVDEVEVLVLQEQR